MTNDTVAHNDSAATPADLPTQLWLAGDRSRALSMAFRQERRSIYAIARKIIGDENVADIAQEVMLRIWSKPQTFDPTRASLGRYLRVVARGIAIDQLRAQVARRGREDSDHHGELRSAADPDASVDRERANRVRRALMTIPAEEREPIVSAFFHHRSYVATAIHLGVPEGTVKSRIRTGLIRLRAELEDLL